MVVEAAIVEAAEVVVVVAATAVVEAAIAEAVPVPTHSVYVFLLRPHNLNVLSCGSPEPVWLPCILYSPGRPSCAVRRSARTWAALFARNPATHGCPCRWGILI